MTDHDLVRVIFLSILAAVVGWNIYAGAQARKGGAADAPPIRPTPAVWFLLLFVIVFFAVVMWTRV